ncbi:hypothetical protein LWF15_27960 [Kineosporia rhizophila]|uniref:hypothetical protein n=1 Tax=Kineosporia rhizophila TaxID=84633 RepID=UPI000A9F9E4D|nr:hypothetical protein [Kineosporia rhizophila]MCE0539340.1 hypothetical protein [Kineosporia rhizophila]
MIDDNSLILLTPYAQGLRSQPGIEGALGLPLELLEADLTPKAFSLAAVLFTYPVESPPRVVDLRRLDRGDYQAELRELVKHGWVLLQ